MVCQNRGASRTNTKKHDHFSGSGLGIALGGRLYFATPQLPVSIYSRRIKFGFKVKFHLAAFPMLHVDVPVMVFEPEAL